MTSNIILNVEQSLWYNIVHGLDICIRTHQVLFIHFLAGCVLLDKNITILVCPATPVCTDLLCWLNKCNYRNLVSRNKFSSSSNFSTQIMKGRRAWSEVIQSLREHKCHPRLQQPAKLSINIDGETKIFQDKTKFKQYLSTNPALQRILEGKLQHKEDTCTKERTRY